MAGFGSLAPDSSDDDELMSRYYDPGTGLPVGGTDRYEPPKPRKTWMMEPDLLGTQMGTLPAGVTTDETGRPVYEDTGEPLTVVRRPGVLPIAKTPEGMTLVKPKLADIYSYVIGGPVEGAAGETALGAGMAKMVRAKKPTVKPDLPAEPEPPPAQPKMARLAANRPPAPDTAPPQTPPSEAPSPAGTPSTPTRPELPPVHEIAYPPPEAPAVDRSKFVDAMGQPIKGAAYTKEARRILDEIQAGPKGAGPIDLTASSMSDVPQVDLPRYAPLRGVSARLKDALNNPDVVNGVRQGIQRGVEMGADKWYETGPVRDAFIRELGPVKGKAEFNRYMDNVAATSPRSDVPTNVRNASYYYGFDTPADLPGKKSIPYPYGHVAQNLHRQNFETISSEGGWEPLQNPKPASFSQNLQGNFAPVTADTHAFRAIGMRTGDPRFLETSVSAKYKMGTDPTKDTIVNKYGDRSGDVVTFRPQQLFNSGKLSMEDAKQIPYFWAAKPNANEYAAVENLYKQLAAAHGLTPAGAQAAGWAGSGELTGLGTVPTHTFPELLNERILFTAKMRGENPQTTLKNFIRGKKPLLGTALTAGAAGAAGAAGVGAGDQERQ